MGNWLGVPWVVENARTSGDLGRLLAYVAFNGKEGIVEPTDLRVTALEVPGSQVMVQPGDCSILNRALNRSNQMYAATLPQADPVDIAATGSSGGRSDLVIARVENPNLTGEIWQQPADQLNGPYIFSRVLPGVPSTTTSVQQIDPGASAITLARIDIPAATGTITQSMIKDMRGIQVPKESTSTGDTTKPSTGSDSTIPTTGSGFQNWPSECSFSITVPKSANRVTCMIRIDGVSCATAFVLGEMCLQFAGVNGPVVPIVGLWPGAEALLPFCLTQTFTVPASARGKTVTLQMVMRRTGGTGVFKMKAGARVYWSASFTQVPSYT